MISTLRIRCWSNRAAPRALTTRRLCNWIVGNCIYVYIDETDGQRARPRSLSFQIPICQTHITGQLPRWNARLVRFCVANPLTVASNRQLNHDLLWSLINNNSERTIWIFRVIIGCVVVVCCCCNMPGYDSSITCFPKPTDRHSTKSSTKNWNEKHHHHSCMEP